MENTLKIVIINTHPQDSLGGSEIQCDIIANELTKLGHEPVYIALDGKQKIFEADYKVIPVERNPRKVSEVVISEAPDVVYWRDNKDRLKRTVSKISKASIPVIFAVSHINDTLKWRKFRRRSKGKSYIKHFLTNVYMVLNRRYNHAGFKYASGVVVNNHDHLNRLNIRPQTYVANSNTSDSIKFNWKRPYICWVANLKTQKRPELCIPLAKRLIPLDVDLIMVGRNNKDYSYLSDKNQVPENLHYIGPKSVLEVNGILANSICLVHTCKPEGFPGNFIQAWLQGKPTVSLEFDPGGLIESKKLGFVSGNSMEQFIDDTKKLIENVELRRQLGVNARKYAMKHHHPETNVKKLLSFMFEVIDSNHELG